MPLTDCVLGKCHGEPALLAGWSVFFMKQRGYPVSRLTIQDAQNRGCKYIVKSLMPPYYKPSGQELSNPHYILVEDLIGLPTHVSEANHPDLVAPECVYAPAELWRPL